HNGTLDKFIGDAIMAFWGAPVDDPQAAANATRAALEMQAEADRLSAEFVAAGLPEFKIGIGLNSGPMRVGDMGSKLRRAYTVMGDAVNLGSRLEGITKNYGVGIIIGETTRAMLPEFTCRLLDRVRVKGKEQAVEIFEPIGETSSVPEAKRREVACWNAMMQAYFAQAWDDAEKLLEQARSQGTPEQCASIYAERIAYWRINPPTADWDGVTTFTTK
ncbi:MAG: adenylate/guanylate cyclase domain-containing protein, partial [Micrococcales bacterium]